MSVEWIERRTGIAERRYAASGQRVSDLATAAGRMALQSAGLEANELDMILVATLAADDMTPATAPIVAHELGAGSIAAIDVGAACAGALAALAHATAWIEAGRGRNVLVIGAEIATRLLDFDDPRTAPLFADGAGALVVSADAPGQIGPFVLGSDGGAAGRSARRAPRASSRWKATRPSCWPSRSSRRALEAVLELAELALEDIDLYVYHQANSRILAAVADRLELPRERVFDCISSSATRALPACPSPLARPCAIGALTPGARVFRPVRSAPVSVRGATVLTWGDS